MASSSRPALSNAEGPASTTPLLLGVVLVIAAALRLWGIRFGLPLPFVRPDEEVPVNVAAGFFSGDFNPHTFNWPSLSFYVVHALLRGVFLIGRLTGSASTTAAFEQSIRSDPSWAILMDRGISVICALLTIVVAFRIARAVAGDVAGLIAAGFLAVAFLHVEASHFGMIDMPLTFAVTACCWQLLRAKDSARPARAFLLAGITAGLATSIKYNAGVLVGAAAVVALIRQSSHSQSAWRSNVVAVILFGSAALATFAVTSPFVLLDWRGFFNDFTFEVGHLRTGHGVVIANGWLYYLTFTLRYGVGLPILLAATAGALVAGVRDWRTAAAIAAFPILYWAVIGGGHTAFARYALPIVPFVCVFAGIGVQSAGAWLWRSRPSTAAVAIAVALAVPSVVKAVQFDRLMTMRDSRLVAADWLNDRIGASSLLYQSGAEYVHVDKALTTKPVLLGFDDRKGTFTRDEAPAPAPDWIVLATSPLAVYTTQPTEIRRIVDQQYELVQTFTTTSAQEPRIWFDRQDSFFVPFVDMRYRIRPGPDLQIYRRR